MSCLLPHVLLGFCSLCLTLSQSYHDLAVRLEPIILELEREQNDLLIIAHESVLRVLYAYQMHCSAMEIPTLKFPRDEIIEIIPAAYQNEAKRIHIPGLDPRIVPGSPEDIRLAQRCGTSGSMPGSGVLAPIGALSLPPPELDAEEQQLPQPKFDTRGGVGQPAVAAELSPPDSPPVQRPPAKVVNTSADAVKDKLADED